MEFSKSQLPKSDLENPLITFPISQYSLKLSKLQIRRYEAKICEIAGKMTIFFMFTLCKVVRKTHVHTLQSDSKSYVHRTLISVNPYLYG